jgi:hypothetical protein
MPTQLHLLTKRSMSISTRSTTYQFQDYANCQRRVRLATAATDPPDSDDLLVYKVHIHLNLDVKWGSQIEYPRRREKRKANGVPSRASGGWQSSIHLCRKQIQTG